MPTMTLEELAVKTYVVKKLPRPSGFHIYEIYDRNYFLLEITIEAVYNDLRSEMEKIGKTPVDSWSGWEGGRTNEPGDSEWYQLNSEN